MLELQEHLDTYNAKREAAELVSHHGVFPQETLPHILCESCYNGTLNCSVRVCVGVCVCAPMHHERPRGPKDKQMMLYKMRPMLSHQRSVWVHLAAVCASLLSSPAEGQK